LYVPLRVCQGRSLQSKDWTYKQHNGTHLPTVVD